MNNFFKLVYNELFKTYVRKSTWLMYIILAVLVVGFGILNNTLEEYNDVTYEDDNWREVLEEENARLIEEDQQFQDEMAEDGEIIYYGTNSPTIEKNNVYLEADVKPTKYGAWQFLVESAGLLSVISLFTIIIAAGIVAHEFRWGTIKLLLIRPISRTKILASKYVSVLLFALFTVIFLAGVSWISGLLIYGLDQPDAHMIIVRFTEDFEASPYHLVHIYKEFLASYGYNLVNLLMMTTFAFMISAIFRNSSLAIGIAIFLMMGGTMIVALFQEKPFAKYILFANTDLKMYREGQYWVEGMTMQFSIIVLIVYYAIFMALAWIFFTKRDVAGN